MPILGMKNGTAKAGRNGNSSKPLARGFRDIGSQRYLSGDTRMNRIRQYSNKRFKPPPIMGYPHSYLTGTGTTTVRSCNGHWKMDSSTRETTTV